MCFFIALSISGIPFKISLFPFFYVMKNFCRPKDQKPVYTFSTVTKLPNTSRLNQPDSSHQSTSSARQHYLRQSRYLPGKILVSFRNVMFIYFFFVFLLVNYSGAQYIYIYAFSRRFYPKRLTFTGYIYIFFFCQFVCSLEIETTTFCIANAMLYY